MTEVVILICLPTPDGIRIVGVAVGASKRFPDPLPKQEPCQSRARPQCATDVAEPNVLRLMDWISTPERFVVGLCSMSCPAHCHQQHQRGCVHESLRKQSWFGEIYVFCPISRLCFFLHLVPSPVTRSRAPRFKPLTLWPLDYQWT